MATGLALGALAAPLGVPAAAAGNADESAALAARAAGFRCAMTRTGEYRKADPVAVGLDPGKLREALDYAAVQGSNTIKVFRHGCLVGEGVRDPLFERGVTNTWGQAKTVTALVTGIAQDKGYLDIDAPIGTYLPSGLGDAAHRAVTLRNLLQASSGVDPNNLTVRGFNSFFDQSRAREFFAEPIVHPPGTYYYYDQVATSVVTYLVQRVLLTHEPGVDFQAFVQRELFDELGIPQSAWFWQRDRSGTTEGYSQLFMRPLEFGRLGELILTDGVYQDRQVVSRAYIRQFRTPAPTNCGYGFLIFLNSCRPGQPQGDVGFPTRRDHGGQPWIASAPSEMIFTDGVGIRTYVIPGLDLVVTRSGEQEFDFVPAALSGDGENLSAGRQGAEGTHEFFRKLMAAVVDMPAGVRATIANSGPYDRPPRNGVDFGPLVASLDETPGTYLAVGPDAPEGCDPTGCQGEPNDGYQRYLTDMPRTVPGSLDVGERRPDGH